ncbi:Thymidylate kinase [hydrothermal vent metagenome]|uniref:dTMP kinase n=1 Tax=hydrothermal vent metagenome TaxID=652676 RepID=A0A3B0R4S1_9ZZZZ
MTGRFITFEGGEGAGKSTQIALLDEYLRQQGISTVLAREPGGTPNAEALRELVVSGEPGRWSALEEMLIMYAARSELVRTVIKPALKAGTWVLSDRFADSTTVYQGYAGGVSLARIAELHQIVLGSFQPDLTLLLDIPANAGLSRVQSRAQTISRFEKHQDSYYQQVRDGYLAIAKNEPERFKVIDATGTPEQVFAKITQFVEPYCTGEPGG